MANLFPLAVGGTAFWLLGAYSFDLRQQAQMPIELASDDPLVMEPSQGAIGHIRQYSGVDTRGRFRSVQENVDTLGARIFLVDYGNGERVVQYHDPRILL